MTTADPSNSPDRSTTADPSTTAKPSTTAERAATGEPLDLPLTGVRVVDLTTGPLAAIGRHLAEWGADVLRVEPPGDLPYACAAAQAVFVVLLAHLERLRTGLGDHLDFAVLVGSTPPSPAGSPGTAPSRR